MSDTRSRGGTEAVGPTMDFGPDQEKLRMELRAFLESHLPRDRQPGCLVLEGFVA